MFSMTSMETLQYSIALLISLFNLYALDDFSHKEIAKMLDISIGTSKSNLARGRLILKDKIEQYKANSNSQSL